MLTHILLYHFSPLQRCYRVVAITADHQSGLQDISAHGGEGSLLSASSLLSDSTPRPCWGLVPGRAARHLAKPQKHFQLQTAWCSPQREFRLKVEEKEKNYCTTMSLGFTLLRLYMFIFYLFVEWKLEVQFCIVVNRSKVTTISLLEH